MHYKIITKNWNNLYLKKRYYKYKKKVYFKYFNSASMQTCISANENGLKWNIFVLFMSNPDSNLLNPFLSN